MNVDPEVAELTVRLGEIAARSSVTSIRTRIAATKAARRDQETIEVLDEIVDELIRDRSEILGIAQAFEDQLVAERISDEDIEFITTELAPRIEQLARLAGQTPPEKIQELREVIDALVTQETVKILQLLGFNFREAIGRPLTELVARRIATAGSAMPAQETLQRLGLENQMTLGQLSLDPAAYERFMALIGRTPRPSDTDKSESPPEA